VVGIGNCAVAPEHGGLRPQHSLTEAGTDGGRCRTIVIIDLDDSSLARSFRAGCPALLTGLGALLLERVLLMRSLASFLVGLCCLTSGAIAQEIPEYDTNGFCERRAGANTPENRRFASCVSNQEYALAELVDHWPEANETVRLTCIEEANPTENYVVLASCIMQRVRQQRRR
jgi:hypothetical protein